MKEIKLLHPNEVDINKDILIDIRREGEFLETGIIENSHKLTFFKDDGSYDLLSWIKEFKKIVKNEDTKFILVCAHANRTELLGNYLLNELNYINAYHLEGGIYLWLELQKKTIT